MSDLISRSALIGLFEEKMFNDKMMNPVIKILDVLEIIEKQPTAYDVDKVVEQLEDKLTCDDFGTCNYCQYRWCPRELLEADETINIIRVGGKKQKNE